MNINSLSVIFYQLELYVKGKIDLWRRSVFRPSWISKMDRFSQKSLFANVRLGSKYASVTCPNTKLFWKKSQNSPPVYVKSTSRAYLGPCQTSLRCQTPLTSQQKKKEIMLFKKESINGKSNDMTTCVLS